MDSEEAAAKIAANVAEIERLHKETLELAQIYDLPFVLELDDETIISHAGDDPYWNSSSAQC